MQEDKATFFKKWEGEQIHSTNEEITQAKKRDTTSTEIEKLEEKIGLGAKSLYGRLGVMGEVSLLLMASFCN